MKWIEAKVVFESKNKPLAIDLISNIFYDFGLQGVIVEDPETETSEDWADDAIIRAKRDAIVGYFAKNINEKSKKSEMCNPGSP